MARPTLLPRTLQALGAAALAWLALGAAGPAKAQESGDLSLHGRLELRAVQSDLDFDEGEDIDSSGFGARASFGASWQAGKTTVIEADFDLGAFEYSDEARGTLETAGAAMEVTQDVGDKVKLSLRARRMENIAVLEAFSADETSIRARLQWQDGPDRVRLGVEFREREYDTATPASGKGWRVEGQYNRRLGSYHWVRIDLRHEEMDSDQSPRRSYKRQVARLKYSQPIAKRLRLRPSLEYRQWDYDSRIAQGDPQGELRSDSYVAPALDLAWGRATRGPYLVASAEYRLRQSNDIRFDNDAVRLGLRIGYRF